MAVGGSDTPGCADGADVGPGAGAGVDGARVQESNATKLPKTATRRRTAMDYLNDWSVIVEGSGDLFRYGFARPDVGAHLAIRPFGPAAHPSVPDAKTMLL